MKKVEKKLSANLFPVIGVGASAGGLEAFKTLIKAIPENSGMAFVLVQHLHPDHISMLPAILQKNTTIPVVEVTNDLKVKPNHIYVIPSNKMMVANDGVLLLTNRSDKSTSELNLPIDLFFTSLAEVHQSYAIGIVLSGTASDGTMGLKAIKDYGGFTFAQDEASAEYGGMPDSAVKAGVVDFILSPSQMPQKVLEISTIINRSVSDEQDMPVKDEEVFTQILSLLRTSKGTDFTYYKQTTIRRRILRRVAIHKKKELDDYLKYLINNKTERDELYKDLLINVTSFFRDAEVFSHLCNSVFPNIEKKSTDEITRVWVAGCSTGEEAYSIAICLKEYLGDRQEKVQIFATDLSEPAIAKARTGIYTPLELNAVSPQRLSEFFIKIEERYQVKKEVRGMCVFAHHNLLKDPPFGKMDFISCRNVLIYMEPYLQKKAFATFHYALKTSGLLLLGKSESISSVPDLFANALSKEDKIDKIFTRKDAPSRYMHTASPRTERNLANTDLQINKEITRNDFQKTADDLILGEFTPAGVVVNEAMEIVHFRGKTTNYLEQQSGKPSHNLLLMAKQGLAFELRNLLHKAKKSNARVIKENIPLHINDLQHFISLEAMRLPNTIDPYFLVIFHESIVNKSLKAVVNKKIDVKSKTNEYILRIRQLEQELAQNREDIRGITEDQEAANEELQSANEELLSGSEELQSLNEELESGKEELQSTNEELIVVNQEMVNLNIQITEGRDYAESIIANIREPLLILDRSLKIKTANSAFYNTFKVNKQETVDMLVYDLGNKQWNIPALRMLLEKILPEKSVFMGFEVTHTFSNIGERIMLLNAREVLSKTISEKLILLSIEDITEEKKAGESLKQSEMQFNILANNIQNLAWMANADGWIYWYNNRWFEYTGTKLKEMEGWGWQSIHEPEQLPRVLQEWKRCIKSGEPFDMILSLKGADNSFRPFLTQVIPMHDNQGKIIRWIGTNTDISEQQKQLDILEESEKRFRQMADLMPQKVWTADAQGNKNYFNQGWLKYTGFTFEQSAGWGWLNAVHPDDRQATRKIWQQSITTGESYEIENRILGIDGKFLWHLTRAIALKDDKGDIKLWIGSKTEIQEQIEQKEILEDEVEKRTYDLKLAYRTVQQKNKELESFAFVSSHDLQEPLRKIRSMSGRIIETENQNLTDNGKALFRRMQEAAGRMHNLIEDLLAFARISATELNLENTDLNKSMIEVKKEFKDELLEKKGNIRIINLTEAKIIPFQFRQLMHNLISNAIKFSKRESAPLIIIRGEIISSDKISITNDALHKEYYHISVKDNGIGFDPQYKDKIFEVFQRLHSKEEYSGTGIGLAIVKKIVDNHNGYISAKGELGKGVTFDIYLPV